MRTPIFGPFGVGRSSNVSDNLLINLYPEIVEGKQGKEPGALYLCPGLALKKTIGSGPIRAQHVSGALGLDFIVSGSNLLAIDESLASIGVLGSGLSASGKVSMIDNGQQLGLFVGAQGYVYSSGGGFLPLALPFVPTGAPITATYQDGYGIINQPLTDLWFQSDLLDLSTWNALSFGSASGDPDDIVAVAQIFRELWFIKQYETEIWYNAGTSPLAFTRLDGVYIETGIAAPASLAQDALSLYWLAQDQRGDSFVVRSNGHQLQRISTADVEYSLGQASAADRAAATGYCYHQQGHDFYVLNVGDTTWCFDATVSEQTRTATWHQRAAFSNGAFHRHWADNHVAFAGLNLVGDYRNGNIYAYDLGTLTDNGTARKWLRSWRAFPKPVDQPVSFQELRIDMQTGIGIDPAINPQVVLRWSDDGGHTFSSELFAAAGKSGETARRVMYRRLGGTRRNSGLDRIFELSSTDPIPVAIVGADLEAA